MLQEAFAAGRVECLECEAKGRVRRSVFPDENYYVIVWKRKGAPRYAERWSNKDTIPLICEKCRVLEEKSNEQRRSPQTMH